MKISLSQVRVHILAISIACLCPIGARADITVSLQPSVASPARLGTVVTWTATASDTSAGTLWYRFRSQTAGTFTTIVDYGPNNTLPWTEAATEGSYVMEVSVKNNTTGEAVATTSTFVFNPVADGTTPVITSTGNPLIFMYSAPACAANGRMRVEFRSPEGVVQNTPYKVCNGTTTMNFYLAGMRGTTQYAVQHWVEDRSHATAGPSMSLTTGKLTLQYSQYSVVKGPVPASDGVLLQVPLFEPAVATDLRGNVIWYYFGNITALTRPEIGGDFWGLYEGPLTDQAHQIVRKLDIAGNVLKETNAARVNEQLDALGVHEIAAFHHEARSLPGGNMMVLADTERILSGVQGPGPVDIIGDKILVLNSDMQVIWTWDAFDHLDVTRAAVLGETCVPVGAGCATFYLAQTSNDWLHGNSLALTPDGNILYSSRHQDWLFKIDYQNGAGSGNVIWRLGKDGDFTYNSSDPYPWFSHQHDANYVPVLNDVVSVFDDGNTRRTVETNANSRGQIIQLDETNHTASLILNADLGAFSFALGSAQRLPNGNYHFDSGYIQNAALTAESTQALEVNPQGEIVYNLETPTPEYRSFRMRDLYSGPAEVQTPRRPEP